MILRLNWFASILSVGVVNKENQMKKEKKGKAKGGAVTGARPEYDTMGPTGNFVEGGKKGNKVPTEK